MDKDISLFFFFFKQKTAYDTRLSLVGSDTNLLVGGAERLLAGFR